MILGGYIAQDTRGDHNPSWLNSLKDEGTYERFHKWGYPQITLIFVRCSIFKPSSYWGTTISGNPHIAAYQEKQKSVNHKRQRCASIYCGWIFGVSTAGPMAAFDTSNKPRLHGEKSIFMRPFCPLKYLEILLLAGWWFGTFFVFHNIWDNPSH